MKTVQELIDEKNMLERQFNTLMLEFLRSNPDTSVAVNTKFINDYFAGFDVELKIKTNVS